jgi:hypothetical protein
MTMPTVARNFNFGLELHQTGLNLLSARMLAEFPDLFAFRQEIPITAVPGRSLVLAVNVTEPIAFSLAPIEGLPAATNEAVVRAKVKFSLNDLTAGSAPVPITAIDATLEAETTVQVLQNFVSLSIKSFRVLDLAADGAFTLPLLQAGSLDFKPVLTAQAGGSATPSDDGFVAILNYLVAVFLEDGLRQPIAQFPVPQLQALPVINLPVYLRGLSIFANRLGFYLLHQPGAPMDSTGASPPVLTPEPHVSVGVVVDTIRQVLTRTLPLAIPVQVGSNSSFFQILPTSSITILESTIISLQPPDKIETAIQFVATLSMCLNINLGNYQLHLPVTLPIRQPSNFTASWIPFTRVTEDGLIHLIFRPAQDCFDGSRIILLPDWRDMFKQAVLVWLKANVSPTLTKIPLIGWVIAKTVEVVAGELAETFGAILDGLVGAFLSTIATLLFDVMKTWFNSNLEFEVYHFDQTLPIPTMNLKIASIGPIEISDNAGGELILRTWLSDQGIVVPEPPVPAPPPVPDEPVTPGSPQLPSYPAADFQPTFPLIEPAWKNGQTFVYDSVLQPVGGTALQLTRTVQIARLTGPDRWQVNTSVETAASEVLFQAETYFQVGSMTLISETTWGKSSQGTDPGLAVNSSLTFGATAVDAIVQVNTLPQVKGTFPLPPAAAATVSSEESLFQLMRPLNLNDTGKWARADIEVGTDATNWVRFLPLTITVSAIENLSWNGLSVPTLRIQMQDEKITGTCWVEVGPMKRVLQYDQQSAGGNLSMTLKP